MAPPARPLSLNFLYNINMRYPFLPLIILQPLLMPVLVVAAPEESLRSATIHLDISAIVQPVKVSPPTGLWSKALKQLGIRSQSSQYIEPGTGLAVSSTAYAPSPYQTDATPCITAAGTRVRPGTVAANFLPFGTLLQIGDDVYIVEDRMNPRYPNSVDIFFPSTSEALEFGSKKLDIVIIGYGEPGQQLPREMPPAPEPEEGDPEIVIANSPPLTDRILGRFTYWQRVAGDFVGLRSYDVNRYDIDCLAED